MDKKAQAVTAYGTDVFDKGIVWGPKLTFANRRCAAARPPATAAERRALRQLSRKLGAWGGFFKPCTLPTPTRLRKYPPSEL